MGHFDYISIPIQIGTSINLKPFSSEEYFLNIRGHQVFDMAQVKLDQPCGGTTEMVGPNKTMCTLNIESQTCGLSMSMNNTHVSYETTVKTEANEMNFPNGNTTIIT